MIVEVVQETRYDELVFKHYGNLEHFKDILELNTNLINKMFLEAGDKVEFPEFEDSVKTLQIQALWD